VNRVLGFSIFSALAITALAQNELPKEQEPGEFDIEPPLLIGNELPDPPLPDHPATSEPIGNSSPDQLEKDLARAKKSAAAGPHLYRIGVIAKVEMEERGLKVVRLEAKIDNARLESAEEEFVAQYARLENGDLSLLDFALAQSALVPAVTGAEATSANLKRAEMDAAVLNLQRQQKLLAVGIARKIDVHRAEEKVATLQQQSE
jgi:hypothetical protein